MTEEQDEQVSVSEEDFLIRVRPIKNKDNEFTGEANFSVISCQDHNVPKELYEDLEYVVKCMLSAIPLMEQDEGFRDYSTWSYHQKHEMHETFPHYSHIWYTFAQFKYRNPNPWLLAITFPKQQKVKYV